MALQPFVGPWPLFQSLVVLKQSVRLLGRGISPSQGPYYLQRTTLTWTQTSMPQVGIEPIIPVFVRAKTVHDLDSVATVIGGLQNNLVHILSEDLSSKLESNCRFLRRKFTRHMSGLGNMS
jgi:hypothetical protein